MKITRLVLGWSLLLSSVVMQSTTITVVATGSCPADPDGVQNAINNAAPGDTIQLLPGPNSSAFNFSCLALGTGGVVIRTLAVTVEGSLGNPTVIQGAGIAAGQNGLIIFSDDVTVTKINFQGFSSAIIATNPAFDQSQAAPADVNITLSQFQGNGFAALWLLVQLIISGLPIMSSTFLRQSQHP